MECNRYREWMSEYIDNTLLDSEKVAMHEHLKTCSECRSEYLSLTTMIKILKENNEVEIPQGFSESLHEKLMQTSMVSQRSKKTNFRRWLHVSSVAGMAAVVFLIAGWIFYGEIIQTTKTKEETSSSSQSKVVQEETTMLPTVPGVLEATTEQETKKKSSQSNETRNQNVLKSDSQKNKTKPNTTKKNVSKQTQTEMQGIQKQDSDFKSASLSSQQNIRKATDTTIPKSKSSKKSNSDSSSGIETLPNSNTNIPSSMIAVEEFLKNERQTTMEQDKQTGSISNISTERKIENVDLGIITRNPEQSVNDISELLRNKNVLFELQKNQVTSSSQTKSSSTNYATIRLQIDGSLAQEVQKEIQKKYGTQPSGKLSDFDAVNLTIQIQQK